MSDEIKHECGLAFIRLRKPFSYYQQQYGSVMYGLNKLYLLMEKQHNRGQDGAGLATVKLNTEPGYPFLHRIRSSANQAIADIFSQIGEQINEIQKYHPEIEQHAGLMKGHIDFLGELLLGHLRYGTQGKNNVEFCHPFVKRDTIPARNLVLAGNFNLVNKDELFSLINCHPDNFERQSDLGAMMEVIHHFLVKADEQFPGNLDMIKVLRKAVSFFDGGFTFGGLTGNGIGFVVRDAHGIRPCYYYINDDVVVAASERAAIRTAFNLGENEVQELMPGHAVMIDAKGNFSIEQILEPKKERHAALNVFIFPAAAMKKFIRKELHWGII